MKININSSSTTSTQIVQIVNGTQSSRLRAEIKCACGQSTIFYEGRGAIICPNCRRAHGSVCPGCGAISLGQTVLVSCQNCGATIGSAQARSDAAPPTAPRRARPPREIILSPLVLQGTCDSFTGVPLYPSDTLYRCRSCSAFVKELSLHEIRANFESKCPGCENTDSFQPIKIQP